mmetsp:Transcript_89994/g.194705  ORF Transcript_89994/g.194705 Transcript_89994/m.194705 type:complete len:302 (+) Transcript_89994:793-1698(+)|eukprot:CAMPEP_0116914954 /NCGR_PEP_ID=MMETSP0467-20121206/17635_1 /TAXON_ID=283647 /ORGANISM="Mesodinium pulex, Strain SPMC105" /LENGTH=301 /DNA_ID=CAMNT_0004591515 /DNA_START=783 /DNA_END=1688 /DNA_ORIENTATION=+
MPIIRDRIKEFLTTTMVNVEFNHTVFHKKDLYQIHKEENSEQTDHNKKTPNSNVLNVREDQIKLDKLESDDVRKMREEKEKRERELQAKKDEEARKAREIRHRVEEEKRKAESERLEKLRKERYERERQAKEKERMERIKRDDERKRRMELNSARERNISTPTHQVKGVVNQQRVQRSKSPRLPEIGKVVQGRPLSARRDEPKGIYRPISRQNSELELVSKNNVLNNHKLKNIDQKLEQLKLERNKRLQEIEQKKQERERERLKRIQNMGYRRNSGDDGNRSNRSNNSVNSSVDSSAKKRD